MTNEITKAATIDLAPLGDDAMNLNEVLAVFNDEMEGMGSIPMPKVSTPAGGGLAFTIGDDDDAEVTKELRGVIVCNHASNVYYETSLDDADGDTMPTCSSFDGKRGLVYATGEVRNCDGCPFNEFNDGRKACSNRRSVYLLREGEMLPTLLTLPPTSLNNFKKFMTQSILLKRRHQTSVVVKVTLEKSESRGGQSFSRFKFAVDGELTPDEAARMAEYGAQFRSYIDQRNAETRHGATEDAGVVSIHDVAGIVGEEE